MPVHVEAETTAEALSELVDRAHRKLTECLAILDDVRVKAKRLEWTSRAGGDDE